MVDEGLMRIGASDRMQVGSKDVELRGLPKQVTSM